MNKLSISLLKRNKKQSKNIDLFVKDYWPDIKQCSDKFDISIQDISKILDINYMYLTNKIKYYEDLHTNHIYNKNEIKHYLKTKFKVCFSSNDNIIYLIKQNKVLLESMIHHNISPEEMYELLTNKNFNFNYFYDTLKRCLKLTQIKTNHSDDNYSDDLIETMNHINKLNKNDIYILYKLFMDYKHE